VESLLQKASSSLRQFSVLVAIGAVPCRQFGEECTSPVHVVVWTARRNFVHVERFYYTDVPCVTFPVSAHGVRHYITDCSDGGCYAIFGTKFQ